MNQPYKAPADLTLPPFIWLPLLLLAAMQAISFIYLAATASFPLPGYDLLHMLRDYMQQGFSAAGLLPLYNGHLVLLPKLLLFADVMLTGGHIGNLATLALLAWIGCFLVLAWAVWQAPLSRPWQALLLLGLAVLLFRAFQLEAIVIPNGYNYPLSCLLALTAMVLWAPAEAGPVRAAAAATCCLAAATCLANSLLLLPLLALAEFIRPGRYRLLNLAWLGLAAALLALLYGTGYLLRSPAPLLFGGWNWGGFAAFFLHILGAPLIVMLPAIGYALAAAILLLALALLGLFARAATRLSPLDRLAMLLLLFGLGSIAMVTLARADSGAINGTAGRYAMLNAFVLAGILLSLPGATALLGWRQPKLLPAGPLPAGLVPRLLPWGLLLFALSLLPEQIVVGRSYRTLGAEAAADAAALRQGARDPALYRHIGGASPANAAQLNDLAAQRLYGLQ